MKLLFSFALIFNCILTNAQSPLASFSNEWNDAVYNRANTAADAGYMTTGERNVIHILNLLRMNPALFLKTVVRKYPSMSIYQSLETSSYFISLINTLQQQKPLPVLILNEKCYRSANCHAITSGKKSYVGHDRLSDECKNNQYFSGECCSYGYKAAIDIVLTLLIDKDVPDLGHRNALLGDYKSCGVSIQPHLKYGFNAVIDFQY